MADANDPYSMRRQSPDDEPGYSPDVHYGSEPMDVEDANAPRRAASARLTVDSQIGSEAALREAMDPANQSLAEALRLSFKVLQAVILVLVVLFLISSCKTVGEDYSGVFTRFGQIVPLGGEEVLSPGLKWGRWPYPIGEFVLFKESNRGADVGLAFAPQTKGRTMQQMLEGADANNPLRPGRDGDGSLISADGDLLHMKVSARYAIDNPVLFLEHVDDAQPDCDANRIVRLALQQAAVQVAATHIRAELTGRPDEPRALIKDQAQQILNAIGCGIRLDSVDVNDNMAPLAIVKAAGDLTEAEQDVRTQIQNAMKTSNETLIGVAGQDYQELVALIDHYEAAVVSNDSTRASELLGSINARLEDPKTTGVVSDIIGQARAYRVQIDGTLGAEAQRFTSLLPTFRESPELVIRQKWMEAYSSVMKRPDAEVIFVPETMLAIQLNLTGSPQVQAKRRQQYLDRVGRAADLKDRNLSMPYIMRGLDMDRADRQLHYTEDVRGRLMPAGSGEKQ